MQHVRLCLAEIAAEIEARLAGDEHVRALAQLDEREARGETLEVVSAADLRAALMREIEGKGLVKARQQLSAFEATLARAFGECATGADAADTVAPAVVPNAQVVAQVVDLDARRTARSEAAAAKSKSAARRPIRQQFARFSGIVGGLAAALWIGSSGLGPKSGSGLQVGLSEQAQHRNALVVAGTE